MRGVGRSSGASSSGSRWSRLVHAPTHPRAMFELIVCLLGTGTGLTCYALWRAYKSMRKGTHHETNRMFRMRIYAQAFTLVSLCGYAFYYAEERAQDKAQQVAQAERKALERKERWIRELEERDRIEREERAHALAKRRRAAEKAKLLKSNAQDAEETPSVARSALEACEARRPGVFQAVLELINR